MSLGRGANGRSPRRSPLEFVKVIDRIGIGLGALATVLFVFLLAVYLYRYFAGAQGRDRLSVRPERAGHAPWERVLLLVGAAFLASRLLMLAGGAFWAWRNGALSQYMGNLESYWTRWDADHYVGLIQNWYVNEGDPRYHIVFFPLYPAIGRLMHLATGLSATAAAYLVSNLAFFGCGVVMFRLVELTCGERTGARATLLLMFSPLTLFCSIPYTEAVFLLTTLSAVYFARRRMFFLAVAFGALSANARMLGMATAVPIFYEMLRAARGGILRRYGLSVLKVLPVSLGLLAYLCLNYAVTGDPFRFMTYQSEHWGQNFGSIFNTVRYTFRYAVSFDPASYRIGTWIPQLVAVFAALGVLIAAMRRMHPGDAGYAVIYLYAAIAPTWLLSGPRYLTVLYALYPAMAALARKRLAFRALLMLFAALCAVAGAMYSYKGWIL